MKMKDDNPQNTMTRTMFLESLVDEFTENDINTSADRQNEINNFCKMLLDVWSTMPELRFGQLIDNSMRYTKTTLFYVEDETIKKYLTKFQKECKRDK